MADFIKELQFCNSASRNSFMKSAPVHIPSCFCMLCFAVTLEKQQRDEKECRNIDYSFPLRLRNICAALKWNQWRAFSRIDKACRWTRVGSEKKIDELILKDCWSRMLLPICIYVIAKHNSKIHLSNNKELNVIKLIVQFESDSEFISTFWIWWWSVAVAW